MSRNVLKRFWPVWTLLSLGGLSYLLWKTLARETPQKVIKKVLSRYGISDRAIKFWTAVSAFETAYPYDSSQKPWNSPVLKDTNNLFNIIVPGSKRLQRGEGQTIYDNFEDSVVGLYEHVIKPFKYPADYESLDSLIDFMKSKNYFTSGIESYKAGAEKWYKKLYQ